MTTADLQARGFVAHRTLPTAFTYCQPCGQYRWFGWWQAPQRGAMVAACETCGTVPASDHLHIAAVPVVTKGEAA